MRGRAHGQYLPSGFRSGGFNFEDRAAVPILFQHALYVGLVHVKSDCLRVWRLVCWLWWCSFPLSAVHIDENQSYPSEPKFAEPYANGIVSTKDNLD
ncbi:hypothetical protein AVEN_181605-1 [Araneus ventricosus]|uniref:Uncharacterized protein n=1 Tax=Araneus ventricosus TaxID=182803 RepID=A0A4Y2CLB0_ARAVE|nr:hypothetical protein AVEN_181605-1 [Araneus ventricosus]